LARSGDDEARDEAESITEVSRPVLSREEGLWVIVSDGESRNEAKGDLLIGDRDWAGRGSDEETGSDHLEVIEKAGRPIYVGSRCV
jgi:hypothetical protein